MESHHEERISELLDKIRADESNDDGASGAGPSHHEDWYHVPQEKLHEKGEMYSAYDRTDSERLTQRNRSNDPQEKPCHEDEMNADYGGKDAGSLCYRDWNKTSEKWLNKKDEMNSGSVGAEAGPLTERDLHDSSEGWTYPREENNVDEGTNKMIIINIYFISSLLEMV